MSHNEIISDIQTLGIPVVLLVALAYCVWQVLKWVRPKLDALFEKHLAFVARVEGAVEEFGRTLQGIGESLKDLHRDVGEIKKRVITKRDDEE